MTFDGDSACEFPIIDCVALNATSSRKTKATGGNWKARDIWSGSLPPHIAERRHEARVARAVDIIAAALILIVAFPPLLLLMLLLQIDSPGPLFFVQKRIGRGGALFPCIKFRTMCTDADVVLTRILETSSTARAEWLRDHKLRNDPRITRLGAIVRKFSLDEFPQLINILRGDMSLVGPRPIVQSEIIRYGRYFEAYCRVRPGLTGLWQVSGRNDVSYRRRVSIDCLYVRNKSFAFDMIILLRTVPVVLGARGSY